MQITPQLVDKLAFLSKLEFDEQTRNTILDDLRELIAFVEQLQQVNTVGVEPLVHLSANENYLRSDIVYRDFTKEDAMQNAPLQDGHHFKVPKVIKKNK